MRYTQDPPFALQVELAEGCSLRCPFCGINGIRTKERTYKFMTNTTAFNLTNAVHKSGWTCRVEFAMHGEPTQNPEAIEVITLLRTRLRLNYFLMETNGGGFLGKTPDEITQKVMSYFNAGLDTIALDEYQNVPWGNIVREKLNRELLAENNIKFYEYPAQKEGSPHTRTKHKRFVIIAPIDLSDSGTHSELNNHAGAGAPRDGSMIHERCAKPFREISVRWDGSVAVCCNDWRGQYRIGNINQTPIDKLWQSPQFMAARQKLLHHQRDFDPCLGCNNRSYRVGLLPDKFGKKTLPLPDASTDKILKQAVELGGYTESITRPWEEGSVLVQIEKSKPNRLI